MCLRGHLRGESLGNGQTGLWVLYSKKKKFEHHCTKQPRRSFPALMVWLHGPHLETEGETLLGQNPGAPGLSRQPGKSGGQIPGPMGTQTVHVSPVKSVPPYGYWCMSEVQRNHTANHPKTLTPFWELLRAPGTPTKASVGAFQTWPLLWHFAVEQLSGHQVLQSLHCWLPGHSRGPLRAWGVSPWSGLWEPEVSSFLYPP